jgi:hypothetical protein
LVWLFDIALLIRRLGQRLDWDALLRLATDWRLNWPCRTALAEVEATLGAVVPPAVTEALTRQQPAWRDRLALWHAPRDAGRPIRSILVELLTSAGWREKLAYLRMVVWPHRDHLATVYPLRHPGWLIAAHAWRWLRVPCRVLSRGWRRPAPGAPASWPGGCLPV